MQEALKEDPRDTVLALSIEEPKDGAESTNAPLMVRNLWKILRVNPQGISLASDLNVGLQYGSSMDLLGVICVPRCRLCKLQCTMFH